jgi:hypothetical protein
MVLQAYTRGRVEMCPKNWATHPKLRFTVFAHFLKASCWGHPGLGFLSFSTDAFKMAS